MDRVEKKKPAKILANKIRSQAQWYEFGVKNNKDF